MEIEESALPGQEEALVSFRRQFGDLAERLVLGIVVRLLGPALALLLEVAQAPLGNAEGFMDRIAQIGTLKFAFEVFGFVADDQFLMAGNAEFDPHHRRNCPRGVFGALVDTHATGNQPVVDFLQFVDACTNKRLRPFGAFDIVKGDLQGHLHGSLPAIKQGFSLNA